MVYAPEGWVTPAYGYWLTENAGRDIAAGWGADRAERDYLREELKAQFDRSEEYVRSMGWSIGNLERLNREKDEANAAELKKKDKRIASLERRKWIPGVIVGVGWTDRGEFRGMAGVGWKF